MRPVPGWSLTQPKGKWPWDQPPQYTDPDEVVDMLVEKLKEEHVEEKYVKLMFAGVSVEEIVSSISIAGFMKGQFTPDVAEIIKAPLGVYFMGLATDYAIPVNVFSNETQLRREKESLDDTTILEIMRKRNPEFAEYVEGEFENPEAIQRMDREKRMSQGFLAVDASPEELEEMDEMPAEDVLIEEDEE